MKEYIGNTGTPKDERYIEKIKELDLIWRINERIMSFENLDSLLESILEGAVEVMGATSGSIMLIETPGGDAMVIRAAHGLRKDVINKASCKVGEGIAGLVAERREGMLLIDDLMDSRLRTRRKVTDALSVPIIEQGELLGVLNLNTKRDKAFGELDLFFLNTLIKQVATAIERGKRMEQIRLNLEELEEKERTTLEEMHGLTSELDDKRRYYQRIRQQLDKLYRDLAALSGPVA